MLFSRERSMPNFRLRTSKDQWSRNSTKRRSAGLIESSALLTPEKNDTEKQSRDFQISGGKFSRHQYGAQKGDAEQAGRCAAIRDRRRASGLLWTSRSRWLTRLRVGLAIESANERLREIAVMACKGCVQNVAVQGK